MPSPRLRSWTTEVQRSTLLFLLAISSVGAWEAWRHRAFPQPDGVLIDAEPQQQDQRFPPEVIEHLGFELHPRAGYALEARILGRERYWIGNGARLVPLDFAVGWGAMSDNALLNELSVSQSNRFYHVRWENPPVSAKQIMAQSANMHLIPADHSVGRRLDSMRPGQLVRLRGLLVDARRSNDGWIWKTSLTRSDTGAGACELMWVEQAEVLH